MARHHGSDLPPRSSCGKAMVVASCSCSTFSIDRAKLRVSGAGLSRRRIVLSLFGLRGCAGLGAIEL